MPSLSDFLNGSALGPQEREAWLLLDLLREYTDRLKATQRELEVRGSSLSTIRYFLLFLVSFSIMAGVTVFYGDILPFFGLALGAVGGLLSIFAISSVSEVRIMASKNRREAIRESGVLSKELLRIVRRSSQLVDTANLSEALQIALDLRLSDAEKVLKKTDEWESRWLGAVSVKDVSLSVAKGATSTMLREISKDKHPTIRVAVASHRNTDPETLRQLANDDDEEVRRAVLDNKSTPQDTRQALLNGDLPEQLEPKMA